MNRSVVIVAAAVLLATSCSKEANRITAVSPPGPPPGSGSANGVDRSKRPGTDPSAIYYIDEDGTVWPSHGSLGGRYWRGGWGSLPYGAGVTGDTILARAKAMEPVVLAMHTMEAAGFIRRDDLDVGFSRDSGATAIIAYQEAGVSPSDEQPFIIVASRETPTIVFTQVVGTIWTTGQDGKPAWVKRDSPANFFVVSEQAAHGAQLADSSTGRSDMFGTFSYVVAYDLKAGQVDGIGDYFWSVIFTPCEENRFEQFIEDAGNGTFWGAIAGWSGGQGNPYVAGWGALAGVGYAATNYVFLQPDPC
jgi:hypothetical protein